MVLAVKYAIFAVLATLTNILFQDMANRIHEGGGGLYGSMVAGTLAGLLVKYFLDKRYIFSFKSRTLLQDGRRFLLYSFMGVFTTGVFWATEIGFDYAFGSVSMRYAGAVLGLAVGYWVKYRLDRRFVFVEYA